MSKIEIVFDKNGLGEIRKTGTAAAACSVNLDSAARLLHYKNKLDISRARLTDFLISRAVLKPDGQPRQTYIDAGWFDAGEQGRKEAGNACVTEEGLVRLTELVLDHYNNDYILNRRL